MRPIRYPWIDPLFHAPRGRVDAPTAQLRCGLSRARWIKAFPPPTDESMARDPDIISYAPFLPGPDVLIVPLLLGQNEETFRIALIWQPVYIWEWTAWQKMPTAGNLTIHWHPAMKSSLSTAGITHGHHTARDVVRMLEDRDNWRQRQGHAWKPQCNFFETGIADGVTSVHSRQVSEGKVFIGFEIEMEHESQQGRDVTTRNLFRIADRFGAADNQRIERLHSEGDSSLHGPSQEIVLMPHLVDDPQTWAFWRALWSEIRDNDRARDSEGRCGMHMHISKSVFQNGCHQTITDQLTALLACKVDISLRRAGAVIPIRDYFGRQNPQGSTYAQIALTNRRWDGPVGSNHRYRHINWCNPSTAEFRLWGPRQFQEENWLAHAAQLSLAIIAYAKDTLQCCSVNLDRNEHPSHTFANWCMQHLWPVGQNRKFGAPSGNARDIEARIASIAIWNELTAFMSQHSPTYDHALNYIKAHPLLALD